VYFLLESRKKELVFTIDYNPITVQSIICFLDTVVSIPVGSTIKDARYEEGTYLVR
jgi:hypothetical protein